MKDCLRFYKDVPGNEDKYPLSSNVSIMEWNDEDWEWPLRVTFFHGCTYEYDVRNIQLPFTESFANYEGTTCSDIDEYISHVWTLLKQGARWSNEQAKTGEYTRGSHGAAFDYLIKKPIGNNKALYRKVESNG